MNETRWWSEKSKSHVEIGEMNHFHAKSALAKLDRGDYFSKDGESLGAMDTISLRNSLQRRIAETTQVAE
jgi:hypothetical protein